MGFWEKFRACSQVLGSQLCFRHIFNAQEMDEKELKKGWEFENRRNIQKKVLGPFSGICYLTKVEGLVW